MTKKLTKITAEPGKQEIIIEREFDVPRELVFKAFTDPKLYVQWFGPRRLTMRLRNSNQEMEGHGDIFRKIQKIMNLHFMV